LSRRRFQTQDEIDVEYWRQRLVAAMDALDAATADLLESKHRLRICQARLEVSRRAPPTSITVHPNWQRDKSA
jgi:hypothetical protein